MSSEVQSVQKNKLSGPRTSNVFWSTLNMMTVERANLPALTTQALSSSGVSLAKARS